MTAQREKPGITPEQLNVTVGLPADTPGTLVSGGQFENFREGWAVHALGGEKAHWFKRSGFYDAFAPCGATAPVRLLFGKGNMACCKTCARMRSRLNSVAIVRA